MHSQERTSKVRRARQPKPTPRVVRIHSTNVGRQLKTMILAAGPGTIILSTNSLLLALVQIKCRERQQVWSKTNARIRAGPSIAMKASRSWPRALSHWTSVKLNWGRNPVRTLNYSWKASSTQTMEVCRWWAGSVRATLEPMSLIKTVWRLAWCNQGAHKAVNRRLLSI